LEKNVVGNIYIGFLEIKEQYVIFIKIFNSLPHQMI